LSSATNIGAHVAYALQLSLGIVFLVAAAPKLRRPSAFAATVAGYRIAPSRLVPALALGLIAIESFLAFAFLSGWLLDVGVPLAALAVIGFFVVIALNLRRGREVPCGCFGDPQERISRRSLIRLAALFAALCALVLVSSSARTQAVTLESVLADGAPGLQYLIEVAGVASFLILIGMWMLSLPELASVLRRPATPPAVDEALENVETAA
jgi:hypothetical protein